MKKIKFVLILVLFAFVTSYGQQKKYVSYTVKKGETIKSIAKVYNLSKRDLLRLNPGISRRPKANTVIIVPNRNYGKAAEKNLISRKLYTVKPKETLFGISKMFGVTVEELKAANPNIKEELKMGVQLVIPKPSITQLKDSINYILHTVIVDDTFFNLKKRYNVTKDDLLMLNPILKEGLQLGILLKIKPIESLEILEEEAGAFKENIDFTKEINVVLMLPYQLNKLTDSIRTESFKKRNSLLNITTDLHLGFAMAIDSLREKGLKINVQYFDTEYSRFDSENSKHKLQYIINNTNFNKVDIVIGPLFFENAYWVSNRIKAPVLAPLFSKKQAILSASNLVKSSPNLAVYEDTLLTYMEKTYKGENIVVISDENPENQSKLWRIVNKLKAFDSIQNISVIKPKNGFIDSNVFKKKLDTLAKNWILIISDEIVTTSTAINNLKTYVEDVDIHLFALNKGKNFNTIDNTFLTKSNFIFPTSEFLDTNNNEVKHFYKKYQSKNYALPTKYAIRGFDVTYDSLLRIASAENLEEGLQAGKSYRLSSVFNYTKKPFGSFENTGVLLIQYTKNLELIILE